MEKPVLEYSVHGFMDGRNDINLYEDGRVEVIETKTIDEKTTKTLKISPDKVISYLDRLVQVGFFNFEDQYDGGCFDGTHESITLNYQGRSKTIKCDNARPPSPEFNKIIGELETLCLESD